MQRKLLSAVVFLFIISIFAGNACAAEFTVFGPVAFQRGQGKPAAETVEFAGPPGGQDFKLKITNGDEQGENRVSAAAVTLNGSQLVKTSDFNQQVSEIVKPVSLESNNELSVIVEGIPGSFITIIVTGTSFEPSVSFSISPETVQAGESAVLTWNTVNAETCSIDQGIGSVPLSGSMTVTPAQTMTYTLTAANSSGTASAQADVTVIHPEPTVSISAEPQSVYAGEPVTLTWSSTNAETAVIDQGVGEKLANGSVVVNPTETTVYTVTVTGPGGSSMDSVTVNVMSPISLSITSPSDGDNVIGKEILVKGTVSNVTGNETGVVVNGVLAMINGNEFIANKVPLFQEGQNTVTVTATDENGNTSSLSITVTPVTAEYYIDLEVFPESGIAPMEVKLQADLFMLPVTPADSFLEYTGPGQVLITKNDLTTFTSTFETSGLYILTYIAVDAQGIQYKKDIAVNVFDQNTLDMLFRSKWNGMKQALLNDEIDKAAGYFVSDKRDVYTEAFSILPAQEINRIPGSDAIDMTEINEIEARYSIKMETFINGQPETMGSWLIFRKDTNGLWKIVFF